MSKGLHERLEDTKWRMFDEAQAKLPEDLRVAAEGEELCLAWDEKAEYQCTRAKGHGGEFHAACGLFGLASKWLVEPR